MVMLYLPGSSLPDGKLNSPLSFVTTVWVTVEPSFLALTRTPSIMPSSADDTLPESGEAVCAWLAASQRAPLAPRHVASNRDRNRISFLRMDGLGFAWVTLQTSMIAMLP